MISRRYLVLVLVALSTACADPVQPRPSELTHSIATYDQTDFELRLGEKETIRVEVESMAGSLMPSAAVEWTTSDPAAVAVNPQGQKAEVTALQVGSATVTASRANLAINFEIRVIKPVDLNE